jgi:hypothetical protein
MHDNRLADGWCFAKQSTAEHSAHREFDELVAYQEFSTVTRNLFDLAGKSGMDLDGDCRKALLGLDSVNPNDPADGELLWVEASLTVELMLLLL